MKKTIFALLLVSMFASTQLYATGSSQAMGDVITVLIDQLQE